VYTAGILCQQVGNKTGDLCFGLLTEFKGCIIGHTGIIYLNATNSFKLICRTRYWTDGQSGDYMLSPSGSIKVVL